MGVPPPVAHIVTGRVIGSLRGYFFGVTIIAIFNAIVVGLGAFVLDVPLVVDDHARHLHRCLHPVPRRVGRRSRSPS